MFGKLAAERRHLADIFRYEYFAQAYPPPASETLLTDLFDGIQL